MEFKKNDCVTVTIEDMGSDGEGIGKVDGFTSLSKMPLSAIRWKQDHKK